MKRTLTILLLSLTLIAASCGGDSDDSSDGGGDDAFAGAADDDSSGGSDGGSSDSTDDSGGVDATPSAVDCDQITDALEQAGNSIDIDPTGGGDDLEASFNESRSQLTVLANEAPELSDDIDAALAGMEVIGDAFSEIGWDTSNLATDPSGALEFAQLLSDPAVMGMTQALTNISIWVATTCSPG